MKKEDRLKIYRKYDGHCAYCGKSIEYKDMQVDHLVPKNRGCYSRWSDKEGRFFVFHGDDCMENYMPSCRSCNLRKRDMSLEQFRSEITRQAKGLLNGKASFQVKMSLAYGLIEEHFDRPIEFYFEKFKKLIRVNVLGKVAYKEHESREDAEKAELYPFGEGVYAVMDGENFVALRAVSGKKHSDEKGDYYAFVDNYWGNGKISNSATIIEHEERLKDYIDKRFDRLEAIVKKANDGISSVSEELDGFISNSQDDFCSIEKSLERIEKDGVGSGNGISEKTLLSAIEIVSKQK